MKGKNIIGAAIILQTSNAKFLFQGRDQNAPTYPCQIGAFGGSAEGNETAEECIIREMREELDLILDPSQLESIGIFESQTRPGDFIPAFLVRNIDHSKLSLHEGSGFIELTLEEALQHEKVTDYTKLVLKTLQKF